ncbi:uncharacterized protein A1O9_00317 [Exophiala aquamarina CBS 119918]|uniref:Uncharacterized protein n=1 Tax=Exophiala aquamarina CBS 119918 TaxID=1182545 RepID=A0A072Q380_9EURO|nr:uncharacterized protein A1O9_00317 [Exophiala aquamarina CBS 119918]KEF62345.1 hypothetical protein A1O9_00317 [Exophiala aquamarina CBS 119918]
MTQKTHILCAPFPGAGHAVNMFNVATTIANDDITAHVLVLSRKDGEKWMRATGQDHNPNVHLRVLGNGQWEDWHPEEPRELVMKVRSAEFNQAVREMIEEIRRLFPSDRTTALICNPLMGGLPEMTKELQLQLHVLNPTAAYMIRLGSQHRPDLDSRRRVLLKGIGGSIEDLEAEPDDVMDFAGPMLQMSGVTLAAAQGMIYSNTNIGLEGDSFEQSHLLPAPFEDKTIKYMIGPILPPWYENALDRGARPKPRLSAMSDECIQFMNKQAYQSVAYVGMGSHIELTIDQAAFLVETLRRTNTPWVLLFREGTEEMKRRLGEGFTDGVVTAWAPQQDIFLHPALKCVISHGGFGTMIEGIYAEQPFITSPVASDQYIDSRVMRHLGMCVGTISENHYEPIMGRTKLTPFWPDDGGKTIQALFDRVFGTTEGEAELDKARAASRALRKRIVEAKARDASTAMAKLRATLTK